MIRLAHLSDLHVTEGPRLDDHRDTLVRVVVAGEDAAVQLWLLTGDLYGTTVPHRSTPAERAALYPSLRRMAETAPVVIVQGNHDHDLDLLGLVHLGGQWPIRVFTAAWTGAIDTPGGAVDLYVLPYPTKRWLLAGEEPMGVGASQAAVATKLGGLLALWGRRIERRRAEGIPQLFAAHVAVGGASVGAGVVLAAQEIELTTADLDTLAPDYGALGHLHERQQVGIRCWYAGSLWHTAHSSALREERGWNLVEIGSARELPVRIEYAQFHADIGPDRVCQVTPVRSGARRFRTLSWRWAQLDGELLPRFVEEPDAGWIGDLDGAEVRARLTVPAQHVASCPWEEILAGLRRAAHRVVEERVIEPVLRVRAPALAAATTLEERLGAYWATLATRPTDEERALALAACAELRGCDDEAVAGETASML